MSGFVGRARRKESVGGGVQSSLSASAVANGLDWREDSRCKNSFSTCTGGLYSGGVDLYAGAGLSEIGASTKVEVELEL